MTRPQSGSVRPDPRSGVVSAVVTATTLAVAFGLLALDVSWFWLAFVVGFGVVLPAAVGLVEYGHSSTTRAGDTDRDSEAEAAVATLRQRYAQGALSEAEFEDRLERVLETDASPATRTDGTRGGSDRGHSEIAPRRDDR